jgi:hypothetical protein
MRFCHPGRPDGTGSLEYLPASGKSGPFTIPKRDVSPAACGEGPSAPVGTKPARMLSPGGDALEDMPGDGIRCAALQGGELR